MPELQLARRVSLSVRDVSGAGTRPAAQRHQPLPQSGLRMGRAEMSEPELASGEANPSAAQGRAAEGYVTMTEGSNG